LLAISRFESIPEPALLVVLCLVVHRQAARIYLAGSRAARGFVRPAGSGTVGASHSYCAPTTHSIRTARQF
jgi:hypothetical protein